jgi:hypothetical protein
MQRIDTSVFAFEIESLCLSPVAIGSSDLRPTEWTRSTVAVRGVGPENRTTGCSQSAWILLPPICQVLSSTRL